MDIKFALHKLNNILCSEFDNVLVCHNIEFDLNVLLCEYHRHKISTKLNDLLKICTMINTIKLCAIPSQKHAGYKYPKLSELYINLFGEEMKNLHNAVDDVSNLVKCFFHLKNILGARFRYN